MLIRRLEWHRLVSSWQELDRQRRRCRSTFCVTLELYPGPTASFCVWLSGKNYILELDLVLIQYSCGSETRNLGRFWWSSSFSTPLNSATLIGGLSSVISSQVVLSVSHARNVPVSGKCFLAMSLGLDPEEVSMECLEIFATFQMGTRMNHANHVISVAYVKQKAAQIRSRTARESIKGEIRFSWIRMLSLPVGFGSYLLFLTCLSSSEALLRSIMEIWGHQRTLPLHYRFSRVHGVRGSWRAPQLPLTRSYRTNVQRAPFLLLPISSVPHSDQISKGNRLWMT